MFVSSNVCLLISIEGKRQTLLEINVHARLFSTLEYTSFLWTQKPCSTILMSYQLKIIFFRDYHSCAVFQSALHNNRHVAIVAGGWVEDGNYSSTEILDFTDPGNTWTNCKLYLPK